MRYMTWVAVTLFIVGNVFFFTGLHNIDNAFNMSLIEEWDFEMFIGGFVKDARGTYLIGLRGIAFGFNFMLLGFLLSLVSDVKMDKIIKSLKGKL